jgi:low density lipoprotein receptor adapter protein 1
MSPVQRSHGLGSTDEAVKRIVAFAKGHSSKLQKVALTVSSKSVRLVDVTTEMKLDELPLYRVSYCAVDPNYNKVCCYISKNPETSLLECHAFLCDNKSKAEAVTLTVAQAFNVAYQRWQEIKKKKKEAAKAKRDQELKEKSKSPVLGIDTGAEIKEPVAQSKPSGQVGPVDGNPKPKPAFKRRPSLTMEDLSSDLLVKPNLTKTVSMERVFEEDEFDKEFSMLAAARSNPQLDCNIDNTSEDVRALMQTGDKGGPGDLMATRSLEYLIDL